MPHGSREEYNEREDLAERESLSSGSSDCSTATDWDHRIIDAVGLAMEGTIGRDDDVARLRGRIEGVAHESDHMNTACEIAVAFMRWAQDLKGRKQ